MATSRFRDGSCTASRPYSVLSVRHRGVPFVVSTTSIRLAAGVVAVFSRYQETAAVRSDSGVTEDHQPLRWPVSYDHVAAGVSLPPAYLKRKPYSAAFAALSASRLA